MYWRANEPSQAAEKTLESCWYHMSGHWVTGLKATLQSRDNVQLAYSPAIQGNVQEHGQETQMDKQEDMEASWISCTTGRDPAGLTAFGHQPSDCGSLVHTLGSQMKALGAVTVTVLGDCLHLGLSNRVLLFLQFLYIFPLTCSVSP